MKLYTEEQVLKAIMDGYLQGIERHPDYIPIEQSILKDLKPIELPSDEEMNAEAMSQTDKFNPIWSAKGCFSKGYIEGAKWVIDKIRNK